LWPPSHRARTIRCAWVRPSLTAQDPPEFHSRFGTVVGVDRAGQCDALYRVRL